MIVKTMGRKGPNAASKTLAYISREEAVLKQDDNIVTFTHNIMGKTLPEILEEFKTVENMRLHRRKNNNQIMHTVLSFSPDSTEHLDIPTLERLTREYFNLYDPDALYYATVHYSDTDHVHVHAVSSGSNLLGLSSRIDKNEFKYVKQELQAIQEREFPTLEDSIVNHGGNEEALPSDGYWNKDGKPSRKQELQNLIAPSYELAHNRQEFLELLNQDNLTTYDLGGKLYGIADEDRNFRFKTLGFDLAELDKREERLNELMQIPEENVPVVEQEEGVNKNEEIKEEDKKINELDELSER